MKKTDAQRIRHYVWKMKAKRGTRNAR